MTYSGWSAYLAILFASINRNIVQYSFRHSGNIPAEERRFSGVLDKHILAEVRWATAVNHEEIELVFVMGISFGCRLMINRLLFLWVEQYNHVVCGESSYIL